MENWFNPSEALSVIVKEAAQKAGLDESFEPQMRPADPRFGDYQANGVLPYAKQRKTNPRQIGQQVLDKVKEDPAVAEGTVEVDIAGPGFINFKLTSAFLIKWLQTYKSEGDLARGAATMYQGRKIVVDYPSVNTAKQMHIGHLRPMVIGESIARLLKFCGGEVTADNHIGDWGTNFGTLIMAIKREGFDLDNPGDKPLEQIERLYRQGTLAEKEEPDLRDVSRNELVKLQQGDPENTRIWEKIVEISNDTFQQTYERMGLHLDVTLGESFYRDKVERIYEELTEAGLAQESEGALVVFHPEHPRFAKQPFIIRKKDGASNYASTDLATILHRVEHFKAEEVVYVTDGRQQDHFQQLFLTTEKWFERTERTLPVLKHVWFGTILGEDGKAIKTRGGEPIRLRELLDEAVERAFAIVSEKNPELEEAERREIAEAVGIGAIRYYDLSSNRTADYIFSWERMLSFEGNTAPYLLYAVARIHSIFRKAEITPGEGEEGASTFESDEELALARKLISFVGAIDLTIADLRPHHLANYLYDLSGTFSSFYNANRVIVDEPDVRARRLILCSRTLRILETGLHLLGLKTLERM